MKIQLAIVGIVLIAGGIMFFPQTIEQLTTVLQSVQHRNIKKTFLRILKSNMSDNTTWFYLNKQAAFVNVVAFCDEANESPLGPIKIILESNDIEKTIQTIIPN